MAKVTQPSGDVKVNVCCRSLHSSGRSSKIVHRLAVFNKAGEVESVVSQSDVIR